VECRTIDEAPVCHVTAYYSAVLRTEPDVAVTWLEISRLEREPAAAFDAVRAVAKSRSRCAMFCPGPGSNLQMWKCHG